MCIYLHFYLPDEDVAENNPSQASTRKDGKPSTVSLSYPHNGERGEVHKVVGFREEVNNGFHFLPFVYISTLAAVPQTSYHRVCRTGLILSLSY